MVNKSLEYPIFLHPRERPDFVASLGNRKIGIEIAEATSEKYAKFSEYHERHGQSFIDLGHFRYGSKKISKEEAKYLASEQRITSSGWSGKEAESDWAFFVRDEIRKKFESMSKRGFHHCKENWLVMYPNLPIIGVDKYYAIDIVRDELQKFLLSWSGLIPKIFIINSSESICVN